MDPTRVTIVGAGRRVVETALPAFQSASRDYAIRSILGRTARPLEVEGRTFSVTRLDDFTAKDAADTDLFYVAVGKGAVPEVLKKLTRFDVASKALLIDTPVLVWKHLHHLPRIERFGKASVAEDCIALPWYDAVFGFAEQRRLGPPRSVSFVHAAFKYHGLAMAKTLLRDDAVTDGRVSRAGENVVRVLGFASGRQARVTEPRDYSIGTVQLDWPGAELAEPGSRSPARAEAGPNVPLESLCVERRYIGSRAGDFIARLEEAEVPLMRMADPALSVTARMEDWKRVGFFRLLQRLRAGDPGYPILAGLDDALVDLHLEKLGRYRKNPFTTIGKSSGRTVLGWLARAASIRGGK